MFMQKLDCKIMHICHACLHIRFVFIFPIKTRHKTWIQVKYAILNFILALLKSKKQNEHFAQLLILLWKRLLSCSQGTCVPVPSPLPVQLCVTTSGKQQVVAEPLPSTFLGTRVHPGAWPGPALSDVGMRTENRKTQDYLCHCSSSFPFLSFCFLFRHCFAF